MTERHYFPNNRIHLERGFSGFFQGSSGKTVLVRYCWLFGLTLAPLRSGISPSLVLSEAKDMIDILLSGATSGNSEMVCFSSGGGVSGSAVRAPGSAGGLDFRRDELVSVALFRPDFCPFECTHPWLVGLRVICLRDNSGALLERTGRGRPGWLLREDCEDLALWALELLWVLRLGFAVGSATEDSEIRVDSCSKVLIASTLDAFERFTSVW